MKRRTAFLYIIGYISLVALPFYNIGGALRHYGYLFILVMVCLWFSNIESSDKYLIKLKNNKNKMISNSFLIIILTFAIIGSSIASYFDFRYPFSAGKQVAEYIEDNFDKENIIMVGYKDADVSTVVAYLD